MIMETIFKFICYAVTSTVLTLTFWNQLESFFNENNSLIIFIIDFFFAIIASNWICFKLDIKYDTETDLEG